MGRSSRAFSRRFEKKRVREILNKESFELLGFSKKFYDENMNPIQKWVVLALFKMRFQKLSKFVQSFAGFTITHVSKIPPKIDIYSMGTYVGVIGYFHWTGNLIIARILSLGKDPAKLIESAKVLVASNYRESLSE